ncbi:MAG: cellulase family glycosylhydrolase [Phaeodactylibacter sp.]|nr:cellulase family glycosylhydrolase [Phaeodactylibacter sp.]
MHRVIEERSDWWNEEWLSPYDGIGKQKKLPQISVKGNQFIDPSGETVIFRGLSISDPDKIVKDGHWSKAHFEAIKSWGVNLVRIPVHPVSIHQRGIKPYVAILDQAVDWCTELGMYLIIDWHSIGNLQMEMFQHEMYQTTKSETFEFWKRIARHYRGVPTVAFYELYNEPTVFNGTLGACSWAEWKALMEQMIDIVYAYDTKVIPLVAGFDWAYDLREVEFAPIARPGVAYVTHPYPGKCEPPREPHWEAHFGFLADRIPIVATELGYYFEGEEHLIDDGTYREAIMEFFDQKGISWCAWVFDPNWHPQMIRNYEYEPTHQGAFFREHILARSKQ